MQSRFLVILAAFSTLTPGCKGDPLKNVESKPAPRMEEQQPPQTGQTPVKARRSPILSATELRRRYAAGERDFSGAALAGAGLCNSDLRGATFADADLTGANLCESKLGGVDFSGARMAKASLDESELTGADFSGADLNGARFKASRLAGAKFKGANLAGALLWCSLYEVNFQGAIYDKNTRFLQRINKKAAGMVER